MKQNNSTELSGYFLEMYSRNCSPDPLNSKSGLFLVFPGLYRFFSTTDHHYEFDEQARTHRKIASQWSLVAPVGANIVVGCPQTLSQISFGKCGKIWNNVGFGVWGVWVAIFIVNIIERLAQKLRRTIMLRFGLVTFGIHFGKGRKLVIFMLFRILGRVHGP